MHRFKKKTAERYKPTISLSASMECDAIVRTTTPHATLLDLLTAHNSPTVTLPPPSTPPVWLHATRRLNLTLQTCPSPSHLITTYHSTLESLTSSPHPTLASPILTLAAAWVGDHDLLPSLSLPPAHRTHVILVARPTRQDDAARPSAIAAASAHYGPANVHLLSLDTVSVSTNSLSERLHALVDAALSADLVATAPAAERARRATRTFRAWFATRVPRCELGSQEILLRTMADLSMMVGKYSEAADTYRILTAELRGSVGEARLHEAAALEMEAMAMALADGSKNAIGASLEKAIAAYCEAGRRELAVRTTLRTVEFCHEAGFPESAAGVLVRAIALILPEKGLLPNAGSAFVEGALAVLCTACVEAFGAMGKKRRVSLYAFLAAVRFTKLKMFAAAACVAHCIDHAALFRPAIREQVALMSGIADAVDGRHASAASQFLAVLKATSRRTEAEVQGVAVQGFLGAVTAGAAEGMARRWDSGPMFPLVDADASFVVTHDSGEGGDAEWRALEDEILEDYDFFRTRASDTTIKRDRPVEAVVAELRNHRELRVGTDHGGSLEMKIKRMKEVAAGKRMRRREMSLIERGAVVGERICLRISLRNPLLFPIFAKEVGAVVVVDGNVFSSHDFASGKENEENHATTECPVTFFPTQDVTLGPGCSQEVALEIAIEKPSVVKFIGCTWLFAIGLGGNVTKPEGTFSPGFCLLERRGRRLNDTRKQRASEVPLYEEDKSLIINIMALASRLQASLRCVDTDMREENTSTLTLRAGEKRKMRLVLRNDGPFPLEHVVIRIGTPQTVFVDVVPEMEWHDGEAEVAIGIDEELVYGEGVIAAARIPLKLKAGEEKGLAVWIRAAVKNAAFRNASSGSSSKLGSRHIRREDVAPKGERFVMCHARIAMVYGSENVRVCRVAAQMKVYPSIVVSPRFLREADTEVMPKGRKGCAGVLLGVEVEHGGHAPMESVAFDVTGLCITSQNGWKPMFLPKPEVPSNKFTKDISPSMSRLQINETATFFILVVQEEDDFGTNEIGGVVKDAEPWRTFQASIGKDVSSEAALAKATSNLVISDEDLLQSGNSGEKRALTHFVVWSQRRSKTVVGGLQHAAREVVYVTVEWKSGSDIAGQIDIPPIDPLRWISRNMESRALNGDMTKGISLDSAKIENGIEVEVKHVKSVENVEFQRMDEQELQTQDPTTACFPVAVGVDVSVKNVCNTVLDVTFVAPTVGGVADGDRGRFWAGDISMSLQALMPGATRILNLTGVLTTPGRYNMSKFAVGYQPFGDTSAESLGHVTVEESFLTVKGKENCIVEEEMIWPATAISNSVHGGVVHAVSDGASKTRMKNKAVMQKMESEPILMGGRKTGGEKVEMEKIGDGDVEEGNRAAVKSHSEVVTSKKVRRIRGDMRATKLLPPAPDDAFWNDADTDESE